MRIVFPIGSFYPDQSGGPSNTIYWHCKALIRQNQEPIVVTTHRGIPENILDKWQITHLWAVLYLKTKNHYLPFRIIGSSIKELRIADIVHLTSLFYPPSLIIVCINRLFYQKTIVWSVRGELNENALSYKPVVKKILLSLIKSVNKRITFHSTSKEETRATQQVFGASCKIVEIPNFLELPDLIERDKTPAIPYFLFIGRIHPIKAINHLIEALAVSKLFAKSKLTLKIAGEGDKDYCLRLKELVNHLNLNDKIQFIGQIEDKGKEHYTQTLFLLFCLPLRKLWQCCYRILSTRHTCRRFNGYTLATFRRKTCWILG